MKIYDFNGRKNLCGERIRMERLKRKMSQTELAVQMQLHGIIIERDSISRIEAGTRFIADYELRAFSLIFETDIASLFEE